MDGGGGAWVLSVGGPNLGRQPRDEEARVRVSSRSWTKARPLTGNGSGNLAALLCVVDQDFGLWELFMDSGCDADIDLDVGC